MKSDSQKITSSVQKLKLGDETYTFGIVQVPKSEPEYQKWLHSPKFTRKKIQFTKFG